MIELKQVSFRYAGTETEALRSISLKINKGKCVVLSGSSGCGANDIMMTVQ